MTNCGQCYYFTYKNPKPTIYSLTMTRADPSLPASNTTVSPPSAAYGWCAWYMTAVKSSKEACTLCTHRQPEDTG